MLTRRRGLLVSTAVAALAVAAGTFGLNPTADAATGTITVRHDDCHPDGSAGTCADVPGWRPQLTPTNVADDEFCLKVPGPRRDGAVVRADNLRPTVTELCDQAWNVVRWTRFDGNRSDGYVLASEVASSSGPLCLAAAAPLDRVGNGTPIVLAPCSLADPGQRWRTVNFGSSATNDKRVSISLFGIGTEEDPASWMVLDSPALGRPVHLWQNLGNPNQQWHLPWAIWGR